MEAMSPILILEICLSIIVKNFKIFLCLIAKIIIVIIISVLSNPISFFFLELSCFIHGINHPLADNC